MKTRYLLAPALGKSQGDRFILLLWVGAFVGYFSLFLFNDSAVSQTNDRELTAAVLVNSANVAGYNTAPEAPGEFQRYPERYLEHLQVPYDIIDVSTTSPPATLSSRQLIIAGHKGLNLSTAWQQAILQAVQNGTGFVNLDSAADIGSNAHIRGVFSATGSTAGTPATLIMVPASVAPGGSNAHYIAALQRKFLGDRPPDDYIYNFHADTNGVLRTVTATLLTGARGTVLAKLGFRDDGDQLVANDPLILASTYGSGRAVHFGTYDYLKADRFGFLMGVDDLFWRSLVWAARKPFVLRGYPRLWAVQMDDTMRDWGYRVKDLYNSALTGNNPWKVTGYIYYRNLDPRGDERGSVIADINAGLLHVSPHSIYDVNGGNFYFNGSVPLNDLQWRDNLNDFLAWRQGRGGNDVIPSISRSMVPHWFNLSDNTGYDMWNSMGIRYVTTKQKPGYSLADFNENRRINARPFWLYERPPSTIMPNEDYPLFFADDYTVNGRNGQSPKTFFLFVTNVIDRERYKRFGNLCNYFDDVRWPIPGNPGCDSYDTFTSDDSIDMFRWYTWRLWSSQAPVELFNHDSSGLSRVPDSATIRSVVSGVSTWLNNEGVEHVFMQDLGDYVYARSKSVLRRAQFINGNITYTFSGKSVTADGDPVSTRLKVFTSDQPEGGTKFVPSFTNGLTVNLPLPAPAPTILSVQPDNGPPAGGNTIQITGTGFIRDAMTSLKIGDQTVTQFTVDNSTSITAVVPPGRGFGAATIEYSNSNGRARLSPGYLYAGPPQITRISPGQGPASGGILLWIEGDSFVRGTRVTINGVAASNVTVIDFNNLTATLPVGSPGLVSVMVSNPNGASTLPNGFGYLPASSILFQSTFNDGRASEWTLSPLGNEAGWSVQRGHFLYNSSVHTQQYAGNPAWSNYSVEAMIKLSSSANFPGGLRGRVNPATGEGYALWLYPGSNRMTLWKAMGWNIDNPSPVQLASAGFTPDATAFHKLKLVFNGPNITVFYDDAAVMTAVDSAYPSGLVALDVSTQRVAFDDVLVVGPRLASITATPSPLRLVTVNEQKALRVEGTFEDGSTADLTRNPATMYTSSNPSVATVDSTGVVTAVANGSATITVRNGNISTTVPVTVTIAVIINRISPPSGPTTGGNPMMIHGANFSADSTVRVGGTVASDLALIDPGTLTVTVPPGALGSVSVSVSNALGTATQPNGYTYLDPNIVLFNDDFNTYDTSAWSISPLGNAEGWSALDGTFAYSGIGHTQQYAGDPNWSDYTVQVSMKLMSPYSFPGGLRARVDPDSGAGYAMWLDPSSSQIRLLRTVGWSADSIGNVLLGTANGVRFDTTDFHTLKMTLVGTSIQVYYDGALILSVNDDAYPNGLIALDVSNRRVQFDDVLVTTAP